jgi:hypothetical protein
MRLVPLVLALGLAAPAVQAQSTPEEVCEVTAAIVTQAQALRVEGKNANRAVRMISREYADRSEKFRETAIPLLVNDVVYAQPEEVLDQDLAAVWKAQCLAADLSSVLGAD